MTDPALLDALTQISANLIALQIELRTRHSPACACDSSGPCAHHATVTNDLQAAAAALARSQTYLRREQHRAQAHQPAVK